MNGGIPNGIGVLPAYPHAGNCDNCGRERDDLFWHEDAEAFYCADVFRCEARKEIIEDRNYQFWLEQIR